MNKIQALRQELNAALLERSAEIDGALVAMLSGQHVLFLGPPGTAKSLLSNLICQAIDGAEYFSWLLTKFSTPEEIFGPISLSGLEKDQYSRVTTGKLPECHVAFLDEIFKANSAILNSLLTALNERKFYNNGAPREIPLTVAFGASNELPQGEELGALYDRFPLRFWVAYLQDQDDFKALLRSSRSYQIKTKLSLDELNQMQNEVDRVSIPESIIDLIDTIRIQLMSKGIIVSDRRWKNCIRILQAYAYLNGNNSVCSPDLDILCNVLWDKPDQFKTIVATIVPLTNPMKFKALECFDSAREIYTEWSKTKEQAQGIAAQAQLKDILKKIDDLLSTVKPELAQALKESRTKVEEFSRTIIKELIG